MHHAEKKVFLHPGDFCFTDKTTHIHTLLGSCISITLWHPKLQIGGMCHFTLPKFPGRSTPDRDLDGRYAEDVMKLFDREVKKHGTDITDYDAKIFGGGNMMRDKGQDIENSIGTKNATAAMTLLMEKSVNILVAHVGEFGHRRLVFNVETGEVWVRHTEKEEKSGVINGKV